MKYTISGHETFACRYFWLKKGFDYQSEELSFGDDAAVVRLGVGKNMVSSIRYWMKAFGFNDQNVNPLLSSLFTDEGFDPFLEDVNSLWLLHYLIIKSKEASIYSLFFNDFSPRTEFTFENFEFFLKRKFEEEGFDYSLNSLKNDLGVFKAMYVKPQKPTKSLEDEYSGLFQDLGLFDQFSSIAQKRKEKQEQVFFINTSAWRTVSPHLVLYMILDQNKGQSSISFNNLLNDENSIGKIFCLNQSTLFNLIERLTIAFDFVMFTEDAGVRELQIKKNPFKDNFAVLTQYYHAN